MPTATPPPTKFQQHLAAMTQLDQTTWNGHKAVANSVDNLTTATHEDFAHLTNATYANRPHNYNPIAIVAIIVFLLGLGGFEWLRISSQHQDSEAMSTGLDRFGKALEASNASNGKTAEGLVSLAGSVKDLSDSVKEQGNSASRDRATALDMVQKHHTEMVATLNGLKPVAPVLKLTKVQVDFIGLVLEASKVEKAYKDAIAAGAEPQKVGPIAIKLGDLQGRIADLANKLNPKWLETLKGKSPEDLQKMLDDQLTAVEAPQVQQTVDHTGPTAAVQVQPSTQVTPMQPYPVQHLSDSMSVQQVVAQTQPPPYVVTTVEGYVFGAYKVEPLGGNYYVYFKSGPINKMIVVPQEGTAVVPPVK